MSETSASTSDAPKDEKKPGPSDPPELAALKSRNALLAEQIKLAENRKKTIGAVVPSSGTALEGSVKVDGDHPIESHVLAYRAVGHLAESIADEVRKHYVSRVLMHNDTEINSVLAVHAFKAQISLFLRRIKAEIKLGNEAIDTARRAKKRALDEEVEFEEQDVGSAMLLAGAVASTAVDLFSLFRTDESLKYKDIAINSQVLAVAVSGALTANGIDVYLSAIVPPNLLTSDSEIVDGLTELSNLRQSVDATLLTATKEAAALEESLKDLKARIAKEETPETIETLERSSRNRQKALDVLEGATSRLMAGRESMTTVEVALSKPDEATAVTALVRLLRAEKLLKAAGNDAHTLYVSVTTAGGGVKTTQSRLALRGKTFYSGGAIVQYALFEASGKVVSAGTLPAYSGFVELQDPDHPSSTLTAVEFNTRAPNPGFPVRRRRLQVGSGLVAGGAALALFLGAYGPRQAPGLWLIGLILMVIGAIWLWSAVTRTVSTDGTVAAPSSTSPPGP